MVVNALKKFPEIEQIRLGAFYPAPGEKTKAHANWALSRVKFNVKRDISEQSISHELLHLTQTPSLDKKQLGNIEKEATLLGFARLDKTQITHNRMPYVFNGGVPASKILIYAKFAESQKKKGNKNYIKDTIEKIKRDKAADIKKNPENAKKWKYTTPYDPILKTKFTKIGGKNYAEGFTEADVKKFLKEYVGRLPKNYLKEEKGWEVAYAYDVSKMKKKPSWMKVSTKGKSK